jgi:hypothetical protein
MYHRLAQKVILTCSIVTIFGLSGEESLGYCKDQCSYYDPIYSTVYLSHHFGRGIGYDSGYTTAELLWFPFLYSEPIAPYIDMRGHYLDEGKWAGNIGLGFRVFPDHSRFIFGINGYLDFRSEEGFDRFYSQAGLGVEVIGCALDFRVNGYFPIKKSHVFQRYRFYYEDGYFVFRDHIRQGLPGGDIEIGGNILCNDRCPLLHAAIGGYAYGGNVYTKLVGGRARFQVNWADYFSVQGIVTHDNLFRTCVQAEVAINIPLGSPSFLRCESLKNRSKRPYRQEIIPIEEYCRWKFNY